MCELLGLNANVPTDICFSFSGLVQRGGRTGPHRDGWGIAMYEGRGCRFFHDPRPSVASAIAELIQRHAIRSRIIVSHIRLANRGRVCLENTHPFSRVLWGQTWVFAHNGQLRAVKKRRLGLFTPVGSTDSEHAFCWMLGEIARRFPSRPRSRRQLWDFVAALSADIATTGVFNYLMSDSRALYAHCSTQLGWVTRRAPFGPARLVDTGAEVDFSELTTPDDVVTVIASRALTSNECWQVMQPGSLEVFVDGQACNRAPGEALTAASGRPFFLAHRQSRVATA